MNAVIGGKSYTDARASQITKFTKDTVTNPDTSKYLPATSAQVAELQNHWSEYVQQIAANSNSPLHTMSAADLNHYFTIKSVVRRINQGLGSIGSDRYNVLIEGVTAASADDIVLDVKQQRHDASLTKEAYQAMSIDTDAFLGTLSAMNMSYVIREISPYKGDYTKKTFVNSSEFVQYVIDSAKAYAYMHAYSDQDSPIGGLTGSFEDTFNSTIAPQWDDLEQVMLNAAEDYSHQIAADYHLVKNDMVSGKLIDVAALDSLSISAGTLTPTFASSELNYSANVSNNVYSVNVAAKAADSLASITVNEAVYAAGHANPVALAEGDNAIRVAVIAQDGTTVNTYTIHITRERSVITDTTPPVWPAVAALTATSVSRSSVNLSWPTATDDSGSVTYVVYNSDIPLATVTGTTYSVNGLASGTGYTFSVKALDASGNVSNALALSVWTASSVSTSGGSTSGSTTSGGTGSAPSTDTTQNNDGSITLGDSALKVSKETNAEGKSVDKVVVDGAKLKAAFDAIATSGGSKQIIVNVKGTSEVASVEVPASAWADSTASSSNIVLSVQTPAGTYNLPLKSVDLAAAAKQLGTDAGKVTVTISIEKVTGSTSTKLQDTAKSSGIQFVGDAVEFKVTASAGGKTQEIDSFGQTYVSRSLTFDSGTNSANLAAVRFTANGQFQFVPANFQNGKADIYSRTNSVYAIVKLTPTTFSDVLGHWAQADIEQLASRWIIDGMDAASFSPDSNITRAQFAAILTRALGLAPQPAASTFRDVKADDWYAGAIGAAVSAGLIEGYADQSFRPAELITREQMAVMISRALKGTGQLPNASAPAAGAALSPFTDSGTINSWAQQAVADMVQSGLMNGTTDATFAPADPATRAQAAVMLKRLLKKVQWLP